MFEQRLKKARNASKKRASQAEGNAVASEIPGNRYLKNSREVRMTRQERVGKKIIGDNTPGEYRIGDNIPGEYRIGDNISGEYICGKSKLYVGKANYVQPF